MKLASLSLFLPVILALMLGTGCRSTDPAGATEYGPYETNYSVPRVQGTVYYVSPDGDAASDGLSLGKPTTIEQAFTLVTSGDAIIMRGGVYRTGNLTFNQGITIQAYRNEVPVLNGTLVADSWTKEGDNVWVTNWEHLFAAGPEDWWNRRQNEERTPLHRFNNDAVFVDGQFLQSASSLDEVNESTFFVDYDNKKIYISTDPANRLIEITAFRKALYRTLQPVHGKQPDTRGPVIRGITFTQYPDTMVHIGRSELAIDQHGRDVIGTVLENCTFSNCFRIGVYAFSDSLVMRNCRVFNTNTEGVYIVASNDILLEKNIFENNNIENWTGFYPAAVKIFNQSHRAVVRENLVINHPNSHGVWWDVGNRDGVFINNHVENLNHSGLFFEISDGAVVAGNVFKNCQQSIFVLNAANVEVYNNTMINSRVNFSRDNRGDQLGVFGWHVTTGPGVEERHGHVFVNNLMVSTSDHDQPMLTTGQPANMCERLNQPHFKAFDNNVYVRENENKEVPIIRWMPSLEENCVSQLHSPAQLNELIPEFESNSRYYQNLERPLFVDADNDNYKPVRTFEDFKAAPVPAHVSNITGRSGSFVGAYAP
jgi:hypothetical protein